MDRLRVAWAVLVVIAAGCIAQGNIEPWARAGDADVKIIEEIILPVDPTWWRSTRWYNPMVDVETPTRVILSHEWACVERSIKVDNPLIGQPFRCREGWRAKGSSKIRWDEFPKDSVGWWSDVRSA